MFQNNPVLLRLKAGLQKNAIRAEGIVQACERGFGFLRTADQVRYFIPPLGMKKVTHGDKVSGVIRVENGREIFEPESLVQPALARFIGRVRYQRGQLMVEPEHQYAVSIAATAAPALDAHPILESGDWVVAELLEHPLFSGSSPASAQTPQWRAKVVEYVSEKQAPCAVYKIALARCKLQSFPPDEAGVGRFEDEAGVSRQDLCHLPFITIDGISTQDMDDALSIDSIPERDGEMRLLVAIADPTAYVKPETPVDQAAAERGFTQYFPGFTVPMLPRKLSEHLCSLREGEKRPAMVCGMTILPDGSIREDTVTFALAFIRSSARLHYDEVSQWLEGSAEVSAKRTPLWSMVLQLQAMAQRRIAWRNTHALRFQDRAEYRFILSKDGQVQDIVVEPRRIAHRIVEEAMVAANVCAAKLLERRLGTGIFNAHLGFDRQEEPVILAHLKEAGIACAPSELFTLTGYCAVKRALSQTAQPYYAERLKKCQHSGFLSATPEPHFGMGLPCYATWTSPMRKYGDLLNHRFLKAIVTGMAIETAPNPQQIKSLEEKRRSGRLAEREVHEKLYLQYFEKRLHKKMSFLGTVVDVTKRGLRVQLVENGARCFLPAAQLHLDKSQVKCFPERGMVEIMGALFCRLGDTIPVLIKSVKPHQRSVMVTLDLQSPLDMVVREPVQSSAPCPEPLDPGVVPPLPLPLSVPA